MDEITMLSKHGLRCIDLILRELMACNVPFGGKVIVIGGDWRQTLPVVPKGERIDIIEICLKSSFLWSSFETISLVSNMRNEGDVQFNHWLLDIGAGNVSPTEEIPNDAVQIPTSIVHQGNLIGTIFDANINRMSPIELAKRVILAPTNKDILEINRIIIGQQEGTAKVYYSTDSLQSEDVNDNYAYPVEHLYTLNPSGVPPHVLYLNPGTIVMLLRNLNPGKGLCNGTRMIVKTLHASFITCEILSECHRGDVVCIPRINFAPSDSNYPFILKRRQYPVVPAFAMTINEAQGQTFERVGVLLNSPVFCHGQLYVALSRTRNPNFVKIRIMETEGQGCNKNMWFTRNIVFREVIENEIEI
ncbi:ATP-dependent DNA helicase PIF1-like [Wyeomyia smithii]|uniref:ATP-dependent DNA helicase PIF1-like n=1 Tax=Wyeomyia smithii TaxID=174621 RepID=UPI002467E71D|nr:ATP-dependent DNA helicase PIF1-like [Wyeomyia smithii]